MDIFYEYVYLYVIMFREKILYIYIALYMKYIHKYNYIKIFDFSAVTHPLYRLDFLLLYINDRIIFDDTTDLS